MNLDPDPLFVEPDPDEPTPVYLADVALVALLAAVLVSAVVALIVWRP